MERYISVACKILVLVDLLQAVYLHDAQWEKRCSTICTNLKCHKICKPCNVDTTHSKQTDENQSYDCSLVDLYCSVCFGNNGQEQGPVDQRMPFLGHPGVANSSCENFIETIMENIHQINDTFEDLKQNEDQRNNIVSLITVLGKCESYCALFAIIFGITNSKGMRLRTGHTKSIGGKMHQSSGTDRENVHGNSYAHNVAVAVLLAFLVVCVLVTISLNYKMETVKHQKLKKQAEFEELGERNSNSVVGNEALDAKEETIEEDNDSIFLANWTECRPVEEFRRRNCELWQETIANAYARDCEEVLRSKLPPRWREEAQHSGIDPQKVENLITSQVNEVREQAKHCVKRWQTTEDCPSLLTMRDEILDVQFRKFEDQMPF